MGPRRGLLFVFVLALVPVAGQVSDPKIDFIASIGQFSLALDGRFGDEGARIRSSLASMERDLARWDGVIQNYERAMAAEIGRADPQLTVRLHVALGGVYLDRSRVEDAMREFAAALEVDSSRADVLTLQSLAYGQLLNDQKAATEALRRAATLDPRDAVRQYLLARQLMKTGEPGNARKALELFQEIQRQRPVEASGSELFIRLGLTQEAAGVEPFFPPSVYAEGFALLQQGRYQPAIAAFTEAARRDPLAGEAGVETGALQRAAAAFRDGSLQAARQHLETAIEFAPNSEEAHRILGLVYVADRQYDLGVDELTTAVRLGPNDERARMALAGALVESGQLPAAERALQETIDALPRAGRAHYELGLVYQRLGQYPEALRQLEVAVTFKPLLGLNSIYQTMGALRRAQQDFVGATDAFVRRVEINPNDANAHHELGDIYFRQGLDAEAIAEFSIALMLNPKAADTYASLGQLHLRAGRYADAIGTSQRVLELDPNHRQAHYVLGTSLIRLGRTEEGTRELGAFERLQTEEAKVRSREIELAGLRREATVRSADQDYDKAVALLRQALLIAPETATSHLDLGLALVAAGQHAEAVEHFKAAIALNAPIDVHRHLSDAYAALGQLAESQTERDLYERMKQDALRRAGTGR